MHGCNGMDRPYWSSIHISIWTRNWFGNRIDRSLISCFHSDIHPSDLNWSRIGVASSQIASACQTWLEIDNIFKDALNTEIDNHADTHSFGKNFRPFSCSDLICSVFLFLSEYTTTDNIKICTAATAWTGHIGQVYILVFGQGIGLVTE